MAINLDQVLEVMRTLAQAEYAVEVLYSSCATKWKEDSEFWLHMAAQEAKHAQNIEKMIAIVSKNPDRFEVGHLFSTVAINTFLKGIRSNITRITTEDITKQNMLYIARDIEKSLIESQYSKIMKTTDMEFLSLAKEIDTETLGHKAWIDKKIADRPRTG